MLGAWVTSTIQIENIGIVRCLGIMLSLIFYSALTHLFRFRLLTSIYTTYVGGFLFCVCIHFSFRMCWGSGTRPPDICYVLLPPWLPKKISMVQIWNKYHTDIIHQFLKYQYVLTYQIYQSSMSKSYWVSCINFVLSFRFIPRQIKSSIVCTPSIRHISSISI